MNLVDQLGADEISALTAIVICQLRLCQKHLDLLGAGIPAAHVDRALGELIASAGFDSAERARHLRLDKDFSEMDRLVDTMYN